MDPQAIESNSSSMPIPPIYEEPVAARGPRADYVVSPLAVAMLYWDEDDE